MSKVHEGWLHKCGPKFSPTWNARWVVLYDSRVVEYFTNQEKGTLKGQIALTGRETVNSLPDLTHKEYKGGFELVTKSRTYKFCAKDDHDREEWIKHLRQIIHGKGPTKKKRDKAKSIISTDEMLADMKKATATADGPGRRGGKKSRTVVGKAPKLGVAGHGAHGRAKSMQVDRSGQPQTFDLDDLQSLLDAPQRDEDMKEISDDEKSDAKGFSDLPTKAFGNMMTFIETNYAKTVLFILNRTIREKSINSIDFKSFYNKYTLHPLPPKAHPRFMPKLKFYKNPWMLSHPYKQLWVFNGITDFELKTDGKVKAVPVTLSRINRLFLDDIMLWAPSETDLRNILKLVESVSSSVNDLHVRAYLPNPAWMSALCKLNLVESLTFTMYFHKTLFSKSIISSKNIKILQLRRIDFMSDESIDSTFLSRVFQSLTKLVALSLVESRWKHSLILPPQVKFIKFEPSDFSVIDLSRICDDGEATKHELDYELNYAMDMIIGYRHWPSALNGKILAGHEALQGRRLRVWVLKKKKIWDGQVMNVNYCKHPPPLSLFEANNCYNDLTRCEQLTDCSDLWR